MTKRPNYRQREKIRKRLKASVDVCAICGKPFSDEEWWTDPKDGKRKRHPMSMEYDHIVPIAKGGHPTSMANAQALHSSVLQPAKERQDEHAICLA